MNKISFAFVIFGMMATVPMACAQKTEEAVKNNTEKTAESPEKKAANAEKAALPKPYDAKENAEKKILELQAKAKAENKNIVMQAGGNWCIWCLRLNDFIQKDPELKEIAENKLLYYHLNYSPDNKNEKVFAKYGNPGDKFGYPVFIILDKDGKLLKVQETGALEEGKSYSKEKVMSFLNEWAN